MNETLVPRGVLLHVMTLLSLVASRERGERERERERDLREVSLTTRSNARARDKRGQEETSPKRRTLTVLFVCFFVGAKGGEGSVSEEVNARSSSSSFFL